MSWDVKKLGEVCSFFNGQAHERSIDANGKYKLINSKFISTEGESFKRTNNALSPLFVNDIVMVMSDVPNGKTLAKCFVVNKNDAYTLNQRICVIRSKNFDTRFLYYQLNRNKYLLSFDNGENQSNLRKEDILNCELLVPPFAEQQRIVAILDEAFALLTKAKANAEQNLKNAKEIFESYLQSVFKNIGEDWEEMKLGEVLQKTETIDPTKQPNKEFIYLDVSSVNKESKEIENAAVLLGKNAPSRARKMVRTNDVIFATVRPTHSRVALITEEYDGQVCSTGYFVLRAKEFLNNNLVYYFLLTIDFNKQMEKLQKGASYPAVTDNEVKGIYMPFPKSKKEQQTIVHKLDDLSSETKKLEAIYQQKINDLGELKKSILQKAFSGELKTSKASEL
jgi:type I restriction enzyme S subunit